MPRGVPKDKEPPKKKARDDGQTEDYRHMVQEADVLRAEARANGTFSGHKTSRTLSEPLPSALVNADGADIISKKSTARKNRFLILLPGRLGNLTKGDGKIGKITQMDTPCPLLFIDFLNGQLKLEGSFVYPKNRYLRLSVPSTSTVNVEDVFDVLIVFSRAQWLGSGPIPEGVPFTLGPISSPRKSKPVRGNSQRSKTVVEESEEEDSGLDIIEESSEEDESTNTIQSDSETELPPKTINSRPVRPRTAVTRKVVESSEEDESEEESEEESEVPVKAVKRSVPVKQIPKVIESDSDEGTPVRAASTSKKSTVQKSTVQKSKPVEKKSSGRPARKVVAESESDDSEEVIDLSESDVEVVSKKGAKKKTATSQPSILDVIRARAKK
ncbi:hypothetical protein RCL1_000680 [Eukaryota sp. TZLM3-RCL]